VSAERPELRWDVLRFRPNVLIEADGTECIEAAWVGRRVALGQVELDVRGPCGRGVMTTRPQPGGLPRELDIVRHLTAAHSANLGVLAQVTRGGRIDVGQSVTL
jgi:uncharacterized protein YcbX